MIDIPLPTIEDTLHHRSRGHDLLSRRHALVQKRPKFLLSSDEYENDMYILS